MTTWGDCKGGIGTVYGSCEGGVGTEWDSCGVGASCAPEPVNSELIVASAEAYFGDTNPANVKHAWTNTGEPFRLESITVDHTSVYVSGGSCMNELHVQAFWGNVDVGGSASDSWPVDPDADISDCGTGGACGNNTDFGSRQVVMNISGFTGDHLVDTGDTLEFNWYDSFNDCGGSYEARLENVTFTITGETVCGSLSLTDEGGACPLSGDYSIGSPDTYYLTLGMDPQTAGDWTLSGNGDWPGGSQDSYNKFTSVTTMADPKIVITNEANEGYSGSFIAARVSAPASGALLTLDYNITFDSADGLVEASIYNADGKIQKTIVLANKSDDDPTVSVISGTLSADLPADNYLRIYTRVLSLFPTVGAPHSLIVELTC